MQTLTPELKQMLASPSLRDALVKLLDSRVRASQDAMVAVLDVPMIHQFQGRVRELTELRKLITQEK